ncbi:hypothetical protein [Corynebacterium sp.]|uniref:Acb2/Tad1 domain-containing protein n=1 Tax=Corynebacterium sp. TaxID=1720 RepID=UPI0028ACA7B4|nr:hypothetical protein [Corynebacterium sp.]
MANPDFDRRFGPQPQPDTAERFSHDNVRYNARLLADHIQASVPDGREKSVALTKVEEAMMWATAGIARHKEED